MVAPAQHSPSAKKSVRAPGGAKLAVTVYGPADADLTVILIHGWTLSSRTWSAQVDGLLESVENGRLAHSVRVVTYDHRGHGESGDCDEGFGTITQMADDLVCVINAVAPQGPLVLAGHSLGGMTIMALAEQRPELLRERVVGAVLIATSAGSPKGVRSRIPGGRSHLGQTLAMTALNRDARKRLTPKGVRNQSRPPVRPRAALMRYLLCGPDASQDHIWLSLKMVHDTPATTLPRFLETFLSHDRGRHLSVLEHIPVAILAGSHDRLTPVSEARVMSRLMPHASLAILPRAGHMLPIERASDVTDGLIEVISAAHLPISEQDAATGR